MIFFPISCFLISVLVLKTSVCPYKVLTASLGRTHFIFFFFNATVLQNSSLRRRGRNLCHLMGEIYCYIGGVFQWKEIKYIYTHTLSGTK